MECFYSERICDVACVIKQDISIGENLRALREKAGLTQEETAVKLQLLGFVISREIISQMELGKHHIRVSVLLALKTLYHAEIQDFFANL